MLSQILIATYTGTSATYEAATTGGEYTIKTAGRIRKFILLACATAATSLIEGFGAKIKKAGWPYDQEIEGSGTGLRTAPVAAVIPPIESEVDLPVEKGDVLTVEFRHFIGTVVTPVLHLLALVEH